jgi:NitT/TauT family transport system permease protein
MSGISYFINQQARYRNYQNVFAAIFIIGFIGLGCDVVLGLVGAKLFPWRAVKRGPSLVTIARRLVGGPQKTDSNGPSTQPA